MSPRSMTRMVCYCRRRAPPTGSPANQYAQAGSYVAAPIALVAGETVAVSVQITDFYRMP
ncbi:MAG: hypothetical protein CM1200mP25_2810 [Acidobacteriota bacterium]|nr:MAG: hypothetical protein CM1200mP25_2810 [Acidobacteriota bacterium]